MIIPFAEWLPDRAALGSEGATTATNVIPAADGYLPARSLAEYTDAIGAACIGAAAFRDDADNVYLYAGTTTKLYEAASRSWSDVTNATEDYEVDITSQWEFVQWGKDQVIATAYYDGAEVGTAVTFPQSKVMGTGNFANLLTDPAPGSTPFRAAHVCVARDFVVFGNVEYDSTHYPNRVWWTGFNDPTTITPSSVTQADYQDIQGSGKVQKVIGGDALTIVCETDAYLYTYVGAPEIWNLSTVHRGLGTPYPWSVLSFGNTIWMWAREGFVEFTPGAGHKWIGKEKVDEYFRTTISPSLADSVYGVVSVAKDYRNHRVMWAYPSIASSNGLADKILCYDYLLEKWTLIEQDVEVLLDAATNGVTIDDAVFDTGGDFDDLDVLEVSLDSPVWKAGQFQLAAFDSTHKLGVFSGTVKTATVETQEIQPSQGRVSEIIEARPLVDNGEATVAIGSRNRVQDSVSWGTAVSVDATGKTDQRANARYHRMRITTTGEFDKAQGVDIEFIDTGNR